MTATNDATIGQTVQAWRGLSTDEQLALFWFIYTEMGSSVTPAAPGASTASDAIAEGLVNQVKELPQKEQLQVQRDLLAGKSTTIDREYGAMSDTTKLLFWYLLAEGMKNGTIIPMPPDYQLSTQAKELLGKIESIEFEQQITLFRDYVSPMGAEPMAGAEI